MLVSQTMRILFQDLGMDQGLAARVSEKLTQPITAMGSNVSSTIRCVRRCAREFFLRYVPGGTFFFRVSLGNQHGPVYQIVVGSQV